MGKKTIQRDLTDTEACAIATAVRTSPRKLNLVARSIRGLKVDVAMTSLTFLRRRIAHDVKKVLQSAIANAENNHQLDVDRLVVTEAFVGKAMVMKRFRPRARGRSSHIIKPFSNLTVIVRECEKGIKKGNM
ncbi:MAG: 50S ribosomal protein L22 [Rhodospirillaceae bacterium]|jgi:large subunit ribosomal protein L22|nr:50S ribosomal protein L22 [Rhodospirillaceae bacterium]